MPPVEHGVRYRKILDFKAPSPTGFYPVQVPTHSTLLKVLPNNDGLYAFFKEIYTEDTLPMKTVIFKVLRPGERIPSLGDLKYIDILSVFMDDPDGKTVMITFPTYYITEEKQVKNILKFMEEQHQKARDEAEKNFTKAEESTEQEMDRKRRIQAGLPVEDYDAPVNNKIEEEEEDPTKDDNHSSDNDKESETPVINMNNTE